MKSTLGIATGLLLIAGIASSVWYRQRVKDEVARHRALALQSQVQTLETELAENRARKEQQSATPIALSRANPATANPVAPVVPVATKAAPNPAMLNDPETRALMQKQQKQALARMADKLINKDFARDWNLSPEQVAQAKELVREKTAAGKDLLTAMMFDGLDDHALAERGRQTKQRIEQSDAALRGLLGEDGFKALTELERSIEDHGRVKRIREEIATTGQPLTEPQHGSLIAAMSAERQAFSFRVNYDDPSKVDPEHIRDHFSEANLQMYFEDMQQLNARIAERAALFLSPEQLTQLKTAQNNHLEQSQLTVKMTTELFNKRRAN
jgi:DNA-binding CsgD family transcriptional regulator